MTAIELETKTTTIAQDKREGLTPLRMLATMLHTIAQTVTDTVTALHDRSLPTLQLIGRDLLGSIECLRETIGDII